MAPDAFVKQSRYLSQLRFLHERNAFLSNLIHCYRGSISYLVQVVPCYRLNVVSPKSCMLNLDSPM